MAISVEILSTDAGSGEKRTITLVKTGANTLNTYFESSANPGHVQQFGLHDVSANPDQGKIKVTYGNFLLGVTATGTLHKSPPSVSAKAGVFGEHEFPMQNGDYDKIIEFLRKASFPILT